MHGVLTPALHQHHLNITARVLDICNPMDQQPDVLPFELLRLKNEKQLVTMALWLIVELGRVFDLRPAGGWCIAEN